MALKTCLTTVVATFLSLLAVSSIDAQHRIFTKRNKFYMEHLPTNTVEAFDMWSTRLANAAFDDRFCDDVIENLDDYMRYGVNTLSVGIQGGNLGSNTFNTKYPRVYNADGTLKLNSVVWNNIKRLLRETDRRGMVLMVQYWYFKRDENVPTEAAVLSATRTITQWLKATGHQNFVLDLVNEFGHTEYSNRSIFSTVNGALKLLNEVYRVDANILAGMSPPGRMFAPEGYVNNQWVEATINYSHNKPTDPLNPASYYLHGLPSDPLGKPYVNNEFNSQLGYERYMQKDPRTGVYTLGHWDQRTINTYIADMKQIRQYGGYANIFSHWQQYLTRDSDLPVAKIGPAGEQPESQAGGGEPSMHWVFQAIADIRKEAALSARHDFNDTFASGLEMELAGNWQILNGQVVQSDSQAPLAYARMATSETDVLVGFEAKFAGAPAANARMGIKWGAASPNGAGYRLMIDATSVTLDQVGGSLQPKSAQLPAATRRQYCLQRHDGRVAVWVNGVKLIDELDVTPLAASNLLLITENATAIFDNLRVGPFDQTNFDDDLTGVWAPVNSGAWDIVSESNNPGDKRWRANADGNDVEHATFDRLVRDFQLRFDVDLDGGMFTALRFRADNLQSPYGNGYLLRIMKAGSITLDRLEDGKQPVALGTTFVQFDARSVNVRVHNVANRIRVFIDDTLAIDATDTNVPFDVGGIALLAFGGKVSFDELTLETGPNDFPIAEVIASQRPLSEGLRFMATDPDGAGDIASVRLLLDKDGAGFVDVTYALEPRFGLFSHALTPDGLGGVATLARDIGPTPVPWTLRLEITDIQGHVSTQDYRVGESD